MNKEKKLTEDNNYLSSAFYLSRWQKVDDVKVTFLLEKKQLQSCYVLKGKDPALSEMQVSKGTVERDEGNVSSTRQFTGFLSPSQTCPSTSL